MKKIFNVLIITFLVLNLQIIYVNSETVNLIEEKLESIGVSDEYSDNIINYITNLKLSTEETKKLLENSNNIISRIKEKEDYSDFTLTELLNLYGEALNIADKLNINLDLNFSTKEVILKDKNSKLTLIKCNMGDVKRYYENYKKSPFTSKDYEDLKGYIVENTITNDEKINSSESNNSNKITESYDYDKSDLKDEEIAKNSKTSDNSNSTENKNENLNTVSAIKSKNMNRVLSIVFLVLFACVIVSLLIDSIFFYRKN